jgi:hypothetical protein
MNPRRLSDTGDALQMRLLRSAKSEAPPEGVERRLAAATGLLVATGGGALSMRGWTKWLLGGLLVVGAAGGPVVWSAAGAKLRKELVGHVGTAPAIDVRAGVALELPVPGASKRAAGELRTAPARAPGVLDKGVRPAPSPDDELALVRAAKVALVKHDARSALRALDEHARAFPHGVFAEEAGAVRVEALRLDGQEDAARSVGRSFLATYPRSAYAQRVRSALLAAEAIRVFEHTPPGG